jgi:xyloglucan glycosyltransferase 4
MVAGVRSSDLGTGFKNVGSYPSKGGDTFMKPPIPKPHSCDVITQKSTGQFLSRTESVGLSHTSSTARGYDNGKLGNAASNVHHSSRSTSMSSSRSRPRKSHAMWRMLNLMSFVSAVLSLSFLIYRWGRHGTSLVDVKSFTESIKTPEDAVQLFFLSLKALFVSVYNSPIWGRLVLLIPTPATAWDTWLWFRAVHVAPVLQRCMDICIAVFLLQSLDKTLLCFGCGWMKLIGYRYSVLKKAGRGYAPTTPKADLVSSPNSVLGRGNEDNFHSGESSDLENNSGSDSDLPARSWNGHSNGVHVRDGKMTNGVEDLTNGMDYRPTVLVQIPMCNERECYKQSIAAACNLDWPVDRFLIQVLDDSDEVDVQVMIREEVNFWHAAGANIVYLHRTKRTGHKAGNLKYGMSAEYVKDYEFVAIFDADFMPERDYLKRTVPFFYGRPELALVQARWIFFNRDQNLLTRFQSIAMSYHFEVEQQVMSCYSRFFGFNGTAGVWRRYALEESGGWDSRTTVEDMDMAVRAHLKGWEFIFLNDVRVLCELPSTYISYCKQQHRWHAGPMQLFRLMARHIYFARDLALWKKVNLLLFFFLLRKLVLPFVAFILFCLLLPASIFVPEAVAPNWAIFHIPLFLSIMHILPADWSLWPLTYPFLIFENIMSLTKFKAVVDGFFGTARAKEWVVTRKIGSANDITLEALLKGTQFEKMGKKMSELAQSSIIRSPKAMSAAVSARIWSVFGKVANQRNHNNPNKIPKQQPAPAEYVLDVAAQAAKDQPKKTSRTIHLREITLSLYLLGAATYSIFLLDGRHFFFLFFQGLGLFLAGFDILGDLGN